MVRSSPIPSTLRRSTTDARRRLAALAATVAALMAGRLEAQTARIGLVDDASGLPVVGAVLALRDSAGRIAAEGIANGAGAVRLQWRGDGPMQLVVRRIGYRPWVGPTVRVRSGEARDLVVRVTLERVALRPVEVVAGAQCPRISQPGAVADVWTQLGTAITASRLTREARRVPLRVRMLSRDLGPTLRLIDERVDMTRVGAGRPFVSRPAALLRDSGWVRLEPDGALTAWAPDEDVLLSREFLESHCFSVVRGTGAGAGRLGLAFEPLPSALLPDIGGVIWADAETSLLQSVEFAYRRVEHRLPARAPEFGGVVTFRQLADGAWIIPRWELRLPRFRQTGLASGLGSGRLELSGYAGVGGDAEPEATAPPRGRVAGLVVMAGRPVADGRVSLPGAQLQQPIGPDGRFVFDSIAAGEYLLRVELPAQGGGVVDSLLTIRPGETTTLRVDVAPTAAPVVASVDEAERVAARLRDQTAASLAPDRSVRAVNLAGFRQRAASGVGTFLDSAAITMRGARSIPQLLSGMPGIRIVVGNEGGRGEDLDDGSGPFVVAMRSAPGFNLPPQCAALLWLDGRPVRTTELMQLEPAALGGIEIYTRGSFIPAQIGMSRSGCGGVLFWSR